MPLQSLKSPQTKFPRVLSASWNTFRKGLNTLVRETEIDKSELVQATNLLLIGSGVPTKRWGSDNYFLSGATGAAGRFVLPVKDTDGTIEVLALTDWGVLVKRNNASYTTIAGVSWLSGYNLEATQLGGNVYFVNEQRELAKYDFSTLSGFVTLAVPTGVFPTRLSGASGIHQWSWRVTAVSKVGETTGSTPISLTSLPEFLNLTTIRLTWTPVSAASGDLLAYNIYRGSPGDEKFVGGVDNLTTSFDDLGEEPTDPFRTSPTSDTTGGPRAKYIIRYQDRIILAGIDGNPSRVLISGRYPNNERFDWFGGGGFIDVERDAGDDVTGLATYYETSQPTTQTIIVFKENSVWQINLATLIFGNFAILNPTYRLLTRSQGCSSHRSIAYVENDIMFANRRGIYMLRYEPQLVNVINANELSAKIRSFFEGITDADHQNAAGIYIDKKYILSYPSAKKTIMFDRERLSFMGPWTTSFGINQWGQYTDADGIMRWIAMDSDDNYVSVFSKTLTTDKGTAFRTLLKTKKEDFGDWTIFKTINEIYMLFRNVAGSVSVNIYLEERSGVTVTAKSFTITASTGTSGIGMDRFGLFNFGLSNTDALVSSDEIPKKAFIYKPARTFQVEIQTTGNADNYELLGISTYANAQSRGNSPASWAV